MKIKIEPNLLSQMLKQILMYESSPLLDQVVVEVKENGLIAKDISLGAVGLYNLYTPKFFLEFEGKDETILVTPTLVKALGWFKDEKITLETDEEKIKLIGSKDFYKEDLKEAEPVEIPFKLASNEVGILPEKFVPNIQLLVDADELKLPPSDIYKIVYDGKLKITAKNEGEYTKTIPIKKENKTENLEIFIDGNFFRHVIANISGEVWLNANENSVIITQKGKNKSLTYMLGVREE